MNAGSPMLQQSEQIRSGTFPKERAEKKVRDHGVSLFNLMSVMLSWALMSLLFVMFYFACFNPNNQLLITVNDYGEMRVEAVLFAFIWIMTTINLILIWKRSSRARATEQDE